MPPDASLLDMMASGDGFGSVPLEEIPEPPAGSFGELFAKVEERIAEFQRLGALEPDLIKARKMLNGREKVSDDFDSWNQRLGYAMLTFCDQAEDRKFTSLAHLVRDTCRALMREENRAEVEKLVTEVVFARWKNYADVGGITDGGLRLAGDKALASVGTSWKELKARLAAGNLVSITGDTTG